MSEPQYEETFVIGEWQVHPARNRIRNGSVEVRLKPLSMRLLLYLARHPGQVVDKEELLEQFWQGRFVSDDAVHRRIAELRQALGDDAKNPRYIATIPKRGYYLVAEIEPVEQPNKGGSPKFPWVAAVVVLSAVALSGLVILTTSSPSNAIAGAVELIEADRYSDAYLLLEPWLDQRHKDPKLAELLKNITAEVQILTDPPGASVAYKVAGSAGPWSEIGRAPLESLALPRGILELRVEHPDYQTAHLLAPNPGLRLNSARTRPRHTIVLGVGNSPLGMTYIQSGTNPVAIWGFVGPLELGDFYIDTHEVTNAQYAEFVAAGGYSDDRYWIDILAMDAVRRRFLDATQTPGPANWEFGKFPSGRGDYPVTGISWFEAAAYAEFRGKVLPSVFHWGRAALGPREWQWPIAPAIVPAANLATGQPLPATWGPTVDASGTVHLIGNVREWTATPAGVARFMIGESWRGAAWAYNVPRPTDPFDRSSDNGFRCMVELSPARALPNLGESGQTSSLKARSISADEFAEIAGRFQYTSGTVRAADAKHMSLVDEGHWVRELIHLPSGDDEDPLPVHLYLPKTSLRPMQAVIYLPPADSYGPGLSSDDIDLRSYQMDFIPLSGRAFVWPIYTGTHERYRTDEGLTLDERRNAISQRLIRRRDEIGRVIDYLDDHPEFDGERVALAGLSMGSIYIAPPMLAMEPRLRTGMLYSVGLAPPSPLTLPWFNDPNVYWPRVRRPVLLMNGRYDGSRLPEFSLYPLYEIIGSDEKEVILLNAAHWPLPRNQMLRHSLRWLDEHLGRVE